MDEQKLQRIEKLGTFILGGVAGAAAGILFAPRSGRETRGAMSSRAGEARESGRESYFEAWERTRELMSRMHVPQGPVDEDATELQLGVEEPYSEQPGESFAGEPAPEEHPGLRAVPREETPEESEELDTSREPERGSERDPEELRRRIRDTRDRLGRRREPGE